MLAAGRTAVVSRLFRCWLMQSHAVGRFCHLVHALRRAQRAPVPALPSPIHQPAPGEHPGRPGERFRPGESTFPVVESRLSENGRLEVRGLESLLKGPPARQSWPAHARQRARPPERERERRLVVR
jgi:hypothetical protein